MCSLTERNLNGISSLTKKGEKRVQCSFCSKPVNPETGSSKRGTVRLVPWKLLNISPQHQAADCPKLCLWASVLPLDLFQVSVSRMCPKVTASLLYTILACKSALRDTLLSECGGSLYTAISGIYYEEWVTSSFIKHDPTDIHKTHFIN